MAGLFSAVGGKMRKQAGAPYITGGVPSPSTPRAPVLPGFTRGRMGATGSQPLRTRNPDAQEDEERLTIFGALGLNKEAIAKLPFTSNKLKAMMRFR